VISNPILNSPFAEPDRHWALDARGQPVPEMRQGRRPHRYVIPVAASKKGTAQGALALDPQEPTDNTLVKMVRPKVDLWRRLPPSQWNVTPETERLLRWWREPGVRKLPFFFCQLEAVETLIWLTEVAPKEFRQEVEAANEKANPGLFRIAAKMATGSGKTTVMAMLIAWQAINAARRPTSNRFTNAFLVVTPGITIRDRLRVLRPEEPSNYYSDPDRRIVPQEMMPEMLRARVVVTNYHAFQPREQLSMPAGTRAVLGDRLIKEASDGTLDIELVPKRFLESESQIVARVAAELAGARRVIVLNDEAHHCYQARPPESSQERKVEADEATEAKANNEAARVWISGLAAVARTHELIAVYDVSATPFFLRGSGFPEGTLFPWVVSDFSLMDAIECGIVKTPRLPVLDDAPEGDSPKFRRLYANLPKKALPRRGRKSGTAHSPEDLDELLRAALESLYGHYEKTAAAWAAQGIELPPVFIVVANNTATSKLIYDFISGYRNEEGRLVPGRLDAFSNVEKQSLTWRASPRAILIDSAALEAGDALPDDFRAAAAEEIEEFRREVERRSGAAAAMALSDAEILREVMNTVGQPGKLGAGVRCVVSVAMLTEGWDANTVTHILGVRAFGTQLLCEQVVGRGLRRVSYTPGEDGLLSPEYADILGIPFDFTQEATSPVIKPPPKMTRVRAWEERSAAEIIFPNVLGYRVVYPAGPLVASFTKESKLEVDPSDVPTETFVEPIVGEGITLSLENYKAQRMKSVYYAVAGFALTRYFKEDAKPKLVEPGHLPDENPQGSIPLHRFGELLRITERWFEECLETYGHEELKRLFLWRPMAQKAAERIARACSPADPASQHVRAIVNSYNELGSSRDVNFQTSKTDLFRTDQTLCQVDYAVCDGDWEKAFLATMEMECRDIVRGYVKNHNLGFEVPYEYRGEVHWYRPDFILKVSNNEAGSQPLNLVVEVKGWKDDQDLAKADTMRTRWVPGVNALGRYGEWDFLELDNPYTFGSRLRSHLSSGGVTLAARAA